MSETKDKRRKRVYALLLVLLVVLLLSSTLLLLSYWEKGQGLFPAHTDDGSGSVITVDGIKYVPNEDVQGILVLGLDKFEDTVNNSGYKNDQQADFLMLFVIDNKKETYSAIHLNRDTMAQINVLGVAGEKIDTIEGQLALAHTYGNGREVSCRNTVDAVSGVLNNVNIERYISFTMDAVPVVTDLVGGVEVEVKDDFSSIDDALVMGETVTLQGEHALNFVRTRQGLEDSSNSTRMIRQQDYLVSLFDAFSRKMESDDNFIVNASLELSDYIVSNYTVHQLENLAENLQDYEFGEIYDIDGESVVGEKYMEFYADENAVTELVAKLFYEPTE